MAASSLAEPYGTRALSQQARRSFERAKSMQAAAAFPPMKRTGKQQQSRSRRYARMKRPARGCPQYTRSDPAGHSSSSAVQIASTGALPPRRLKSRSSDGVGSHECPAAGALALVRYLGRDHAAADPIQIRFDNLTRPQSACTQTLLVPWRVLAQLAQVGRANGPVRCEQRVHREVNPAQ
eukprot:CAMPEP_0180015518 /NCGR_PEP_ID=MMETSP0984-20121128/18791_1 /TAXON_ID=483367 /ORGANISM="non described non described, Strain CCMP 2436" /LENGTH=179 /DNA_ID=CAMNT_0021938341 /DNA_START=338 /DNA_END=879 /DNA_ORIENTATION=+